MHKATFSIRSYGTPKAARLVTACVLAATTIGCTPLQFGANQCPDINVNINGPKDDPLVAAMDPDVDAVMDDYLNADGLFQNSNPPPGCAVGIMQNNAISAVKGYGLADIDNNVAFTHVTPAVVGSVSKTWTALAALRLEEMGLLSIGDPVSDYLPGVPAAWQNITIEELLSHTSGLVREPVFDPSINDEVELSQFLFPQLQPILNLGIHPSLVYWSYHQTGVDGLGFNQAQYSNAGYMLLGAVIDRIVASNSQLVGEDFDTYESFVWRQVGAFDGNLNNGEQMFSQCLNEYWRQNDIANLAKGYTFNGNTYQETTFFNSPTLQLGPAGWEGPPGGWTMTIGDLVRLMAGLQNDDIISGPTKADMMTVRGSENSGNWGLGVNLISKLGRPVFMHDGKYPGFRARYTVWPGEDFGVAIMCNESNVGMRTITDEIAKIFIGASAGAGLAGLAQVSPLSVAAVQTIDEDDPGLGAGVSPESDPPLLSNREARTIARELRHEERQQLRLAKQRRKAEKLAHKHRCLRLVEHLLSEQGTRFAEPYARCAETNSRSAFRKCVAHLSNKLKKNGHISGRQKGWIQSCAATTDLSEVMTLRIEPTEIRWTE